VAGLTAAHELVQRGFDVVVLERRHNAGGKARSIKVEPTRLGPDPHHLHPHKSEGGWVPGEHGFRFFPGFYRHVIDTMGRIPFSDGSTVADNLVPTTRVGISQYDLPMFELPARFPRTFDDALTVLEAIIYGFSPVTGLSPGEVAHFGTRIWQILTSCPERRLAEYEKIPWWQFIDADDRSVAYQKFLASGITRSLVAAKAISASTRTIGDIFVQLILTILDPMASSTDRVLNGPTSQVWIDPWRELIVASGAEYRAGQIVSRIHCDNGWITGVDVQHAGGHETVRGDYYVCALPIERTAPLLNPAILQGDPTLASLEALAGNVEWMNGLQLYLYKDLPLLHGHVIHIDTEWALTSISQLQFWSDERVAYHGGSEVIGGILSIDISDWETPGINGRAAIECSREQVALEVCEELKRSINSSGFGELTDDDLWAWFLDPDIRPEHGTRGRLVNLEPLLVNLADTWRLRPEAVTAIPNFFLASDYVRTFTDLATMEAANEAARRAVNGVLEASEFQGDRCELWPLQEPEVLAPFREYDAARFKLGLPWDATLVDLVDSVARGTAPAMRDLSSTAGGTELVQAIEQALTHIDQGSKTVGVDVAEGIVSEPLEQIRGSVAPLTPVTGLLADVSSPSDTLTHGRGIEDHTPEVGGSGVPIGRRVSDGPIPFLERLEWYRGQVLSTLREAIPDKEPLKYLYGPMWEFIDRPAKGLRPSLCLATCRSLGGDSGEALKSAAGLELLHNAFLVHDDIEDASSSRRGGRTVHRQFGEAVAINVGDALYAHAMRLFRDNIADLGPERSLAILEEVDHLVLETLEGQAIELGWVKDNDTSVGVEDYLRMVLKKTAWYSFIHPIRIGALVAGDCDDLDRFNRFGFLLGAAFQIRDDVLNLVGSVGRYGKEIGGDLWEGKRSLVMSYAFTHADPSVVRQLTEFLGRPRYDRLPRQVAVIQELLDQSGAINWASTAAELLLEAAQQQFVVAFSEVDEGPDLAFIRSLISYMVERDK
jgi:geranylgeranyl pyrophosphate synthase/uncharacterized protein with NAD-binding domain and iron-sulfur cluster